MIPVEKREIFEEQETVNEVLEVQQRLSQPVWRRTTCMYYDSQTILTPGQMTRTQKSIESLMQRNQP